MLATQSQIKNWQRAKIGYLGRVVTGKTPPTKNQEYYGDKYPFITPTDISDNSIYVMPERYLSEEGEHEKLLQVNYRRTLYVTHALPLSVKSQLLEKKVLPISKSIAL